MWKQLKMNMHRKHSQSNNSLFSPSFIYLLLTTQKQTHTPSVTLKSKPSGGARNHKPAQHIHQEMGITATMATRSHPTNKTNLRWELPCCPPFCQIRGNQPKCFVLRGADFLKSTPCQLICGNDRYNHCYSGQQTVMWWILHGVLCLVSVSLCILCASSILSNFHNAEIVGGADMVIQDWTAWIKLGLSGQHSGSR